MRVGECVGGDKHQREQELCWDADLYDLSLGVFGPEGLWRRRAAHRYEAVRLPIQSRSQQVRAGWRETQNTRSHDPLHLNGRTGVHDNVSDTSMNDSPTLNSSTGSSGS